MKKSEILKIAQANAERISAIEKHLFGKQPTESKQLEVGKWYKSTDPCKKALFCSTNGQCSVDCGYGLDYKGVWRENFNSFGSKPEELTEATPQEVEEALIAEAKRRYKTGDTLSPVYDDNCRSDRVFYDNLCFQSSEEGDKIWVDNVNGSYYSACIYLNGKWATVIEQDKFAELKEAHKNGAVIQYKHHKNGYWLTCDNDPKWDINTRYRIKPEEKPKVGDVCKFWDDDENAFVVAKYAELRQDNGWDDMSLTHPHGVRVTGNFHTRFYKNAKPLSKTEVIELLFGKEEANGQ